ncbi:MULTISPECIES: hypothetical protein [unclassified Nocardia]|nr:MULTISPECIES: hypothetical protein [unclassified Nocardia]
MERVEFPGGRDGLGHVQRRVRRRIALRGFPGGTLRQQGAANTRQA